MRQFDCLFLVILNYTSYFGFHTIKLHYRGIKLSNKLNDVKKNLLIKNKLINAGICPCDLRTSERDRITGISIKGSFDILDELLSKYPEGKTGDNYLVDGNLFFWDSEICAWKDAGPIKGSKGDKVMLEKKVTQEKKEILALKETLGQLVYLGLLF